MFHTTLFPRTYISLSKIRLIVLLIRKDKVKKKVRFYGNSTIKKVQFTKPSIPNSHEHRSAGTQPGVTLQPPLVINGPSFYSPWCLDVFRLAAVFIDRAPSSPRLPLLHLLPSQPVLQYSAISDVELGGFQGCSCQRYRGHS